MADVAEDDKDMEHGVDVGHTLEAVEHSARDISYTLANDPEDDGEATTVVEGFESDEYGEPHEHITGGLEVALRLHLAETQCCAHDSTQPHKEKDDEAPHWFAS